MQVEHHHIISKALQYHVYSLLQPTELIILKTSIEECSIIRSPLFTVGGYSAYELLGSGAFGNVYKVS